MALRAVDELIELLEARWQPFPETLAALPPEDFDRRTASGWTVKEMLGHVAFWMETIQPVFVGMFRGQPIEDREWYGGDDLGVTGEWPRTEVHNAREAAWARPRPLSEVLDRLDAAYQRTVEAVQTLTEDELSDGRFTKKVMDGACDHLVMHLAELRSLN